MCFSASASFGAAAVLTVIGVVSIKKVHHPSQIVFACIPFMFAAQQLSEGVLWLTIPNKQYSSLQNIATYIYLIFAQTIWPLLVPVAILLLEKEQTRKLPQRIFVVMGLLASIFLTYCLINYSVEAKIESFHIYYIQHYPKTPRIFFTAFYLIAIIAPSFFSHIKRMWMIGIAIFFSFSISFIFYKLYLISVWCFFASLISISVYLILKELKDNYTKNAQTLS
jgi:hypothetical protein